jgi:hypothetical protein
MFLNIFLCSCTLYLPAELPATGSVTKKWHLNLILRFFFQSPLLTMLRCSRSGMRDFIIYRTNSTFLTQRHVSLSFVPLCLPLTHCLQFIKNCKKKLVVLCVLYATYPTNVCGSFPYKCQPVLSNAIWKGRAMAQAVSRRPPTLETRVRSRFCSCGSLWWTKWQWNRFFPEYFGNLIPPILHYTEKRKNWSSFSSSQGLHNKP